MIRIHGRATSSNVQLVMWAVGDLGLAHERIDAGGAFGGLDSDEFTAMNPNKLIPVLSDDGLVVWESAAILRYLAAEYGDAHFWPAEPRRRAELDKWAEWGKISFAPTLTAIFWQLVRMKPEDRDHAGLEQAVSRMAVLAKVLDHELSGRDYIRGEHLSFADIAVAHVLYRYMTLDFDKDDTPNLDAYYQRLTGRPAFKAHVMVSYESLKVT